MADIDITKVPERFLGLGLMSSFASGSVGNVYYICDIFNHREYALKVIECGGSMTKFRNARYEIDVMQQLSHIAGVVRIIDSEIVEDGESRTVYILEEYHVPFADYLKKNPLTVRDKVNMLAELCGILSQCRDAGVLHLDLQLRNLFVDPEGKILLSDFSSALLLKDLDKNKAMRGTLAYMAPEVYRNGQCSERSDIYAVGMVLHHVIAPELFPSVRWVGDELSVYKRLAGAPLYGEARENDALCEAVKQTVGHVCAFDPKDRPESFEQLHDILRSLAEKAEAAQQPCPVPVPPSHRRRMNVFYLVQTSSIMEGERIQEINRIGQQTLQMLQGIQTGQPDLEIRTSILSFGGETAWHQIATELNEGSLWPELKAGGTAYIRNALRRFIRELLRPEFRSDNDCVCIPIMIFITDGSFGGFDKRDMDLLNRHLWFEDVVKVAIAVGNVNDYRNIRKIIGSRGVILQKDELSMLPELISPMPHYKSVCLSKR